jgi:hypothetical protein
VKFCQNVKNKKVKNNILSWFGAGAELGAGAAAGAGYCSQQALVKELVLEPSGSGSGAPAL